VTLAERIKALHLALARNEIPHAFGGAIALAYWTLDPRGTGDIDLNVFVPANDCSAALQALPRGVARPAGTAERIATDGQIRLWWDETPLDLFFDYVPVHAEAARHRRTVPFADIQIPVLGPVELTVFKAMLDRTRDWADIEAMISAETVDLDAVRESLRSMLEDDDARFGRLDEAVRRAGPGATPA
jgi:nucleotidyltransferase AbiEii toxin of type IV toxin-antitoxin system